MRPLARATFFRVIKKCVRNAAGATRALHRRKNRRPGGGPGNVSLAPHVRILGNLSRGNRSADPAARLASCCCRIIATTDVAVARNFRAPSSSGRKHVSLAEDKKVAVGAAAVEERNVEVRGEREGARKERSAVATYGGCSRSRPFGNPELSVEARRIAVGVPRLSRPSRRLPPSRFLCTARRRKRRSCHCLRSRCDDMHRVPRRLEFRDRVRGEFNAGKSGALSRASDTTRATTNYVLRSHSPIPTDARLAANGPDVAHVRLNGWRSFNGATAREGARASKDEGQPLKLFVASFALLRVRLHS